MRGFELAEIRAAIVCAYNRATFDRMLSDRLEFERAEHVADGPFNDVVEGVLRVFTHQGREAELIAEIAADRPAKREIQHVYRKYAHGLLSAAWSARIDGEIGEQLARYGLLPTTELQRTGVVHRGTPADPASRGFGGFQRWIRAELPELDAVVWSARLLRLAHRVCRVELGGVPRGTGFLVGPDAVLTSYHVVREAITDRADGATLGFLFDHSVGSDGSTAAGVRVAARAAWPHWHVDSSPPLSTEDEQAGVTAGSDDRLDHAVIALAQLVGSAPVVPGGPCRGWIELPEPAPSLTIGMPIAVLHHPRTGPLKLTLDTHSLQGIHPDRRRIRYSTNTDAGSSGSPCLDVQLGLVAVHHFSDPAHAMPAYNQGTTIEAIRRRLEAQGRLGALGGVSPDEDPPCS
jgi:hypothetical protein